MANKFLVYFCILLSLSSCVDRKIKQGFNENISEVSKFHDDYDQTEEEVAIDQEASQELLCSRASLNLKDATALNLGKLLSNIYNINIHTDPAFIDQNIPISFNMQDVCINHVLDHLTEVYNIGYTKSASGYSIYPPMIKTRTFPVSYHNFNRQGASSMSVRGSRLTDKNNNNDYYGDSTNNGSGFAAISTKSEESFWANIEKNLRLIAREDSIQTNKSSQGQASATSDSSEISVYKETGLVIVKAYPRAMRAVENFLNTVNKNSIRQVVIEAKILEITLTDDFNSGVQWDLLKQNLHLTSFATKVTKNSGNALPEIVSGNSLSSFVRAGLGNRTDFKAVLQALSTQGKVSVLSSPRISTLNNQRALIKYGEDTYYVTNVSSTTQVSAVAGAVAPTTSSFTMTPFFEGVALDATPNIMSDDELVMHIHPMVTMVKSKDVNVKLSGQDTNLKAAAIFSREADTVVKARSGDIIILGGMAQNDVVLNSSGVPIDLPKSSGLSSILSNAFGAKQYSRSKTELVILLKPTIVKKFDINSNTELSRYILPD
jgi:MSHA biogenesis protein MshL